MKCFFSHFSSSGHERTVNNIFCLQHSLKCKLSFLTCQVKMLVSSIGFPSPTAPVGYVHETRTPTCPSPAELPLCCPPEGTCISLNISLHLRWPGKDERKQYIYIDAKGNQGDTKWRVKDMSAIEIKTRRGIKTRVGEKEMGRSVYQRELRRKTFLHVTGTTPGQGRLK